jgi:precorrin-8X/cobalt-precorrin-8 methylmutase
MATLTRTNIRRRMIERQMPALFDHYLIVDWSAANQAKTGRDSIWICALGPNGERCDNPPTRHAAKALLGDRLAAILARGERALVGFDFPFGYPSGFARRLGLSGPPWRATWDEIVRRMQDDETNANNRFEVAAGFNERASGGLFPFWGCPARRASRFLGSKHHRQAEPDGLRERRLIDERMVGAQPCWKLLGAGSVGGQVLTGIPVVHALRDDGRLRDDARIWPFETGLRAPGEGRLVFAELWPSWWKADIRPHYGPPHDRAQVRSVAQIVAAQDRAGKLAPWFAGDPSLSLAERRQVETEEAWTLGVTAHPPRATPLRDAGV